MVGAEYFLFELGPLGFSLGPLQEGASKGVPY